MADFTVRTNSGKRPSCHIGKSGRLYRWQRIFQLGKIFYSVTDESDAERATLGIFKEKTAGGTVGGIFDPLFNFIDDNQNVFTGDVSKEIDKYNIMQYNISAALRKDNVNGGFDIKG